MYAFTKKHLVVDKMLFSLSSVRGLCRLPGVFADGVVRWLCGETPGLELALTPSTFYLTDMTVRLQQNNSSGGIYFITFTCYNWKPLFELTNTYEAVYKWFDYLCQKSAAVIGFVIMPNHLHALLHLPATFKTVNIVVSNAKRFLAYEIIKQLEAQGAEAILQELHAAVKKREAKKGQIHRVFEESFDAKLCYSPGFVQQKLDYIHHNPVRGKWKLVDDFALYSHSSAGFYFGTEANVYKGIKRVEEVA